MERAVLRVSGQDRIAFLQDLVTNDLGKLDAGPLYAALLTPQGKYLADFLLWPADDAVLVDVAAALAEPLAKRLTMYRLRRQVEIAPTELAVATGAGTPDPRHPALPPRQLVAGGRAPDPLSVRVAETIPESGIELTPDTFILEAGFERLNGVDFKKGCFVGQEVVARMKHKTELRKGLARVRVTGAAPVGTPIEAGEREVGTLFSQADGFGLAHVRLDRLGGEMRAGAAIVAAL